ncbi:MBOAT, membrane-bound O-acyltransferase family-domain-containing protein [Geranomyces variabilis]|nr:MBOAT, membrane-bound O-acyltransferase family-domain-containing protein [Geranomyces variabilis]KAJ3134149.1 hypothetical protein HDU90_005246 [Geranomyces variabilis]
MTTAQSPRARRTSPKRRDVIPAQATPVTTDPWPDLPPAANVKPKAAAPAPQPVSASQVPPPYSHTYPVHTAIRASPLSKESPEQNYRGFFNLAMLLLAVSNLRLVIENHRKYGFIISMPLTGIRQADAEWAVVSYAWQMAMMLAVLGVEKYASGGRPPAKRNERLIAVLYTVCTALLISVPTVICWYRIWNPAFSAATLFGATILSLKVISYALVNADYRRGNLMSPLFRQISDPDGAGPSEADVAAAVPGMEAISYPDNVTLGNLAYFMFCPTLCYQLSFPRTTRFRKTFFAKRLLEFCLGTAAIYLLGGQYAAPTLRNSIVALDNLDFPHLFERLLKLSIVSVVIWLLMFYSVFHAGMNMIAEVLRFGDRRFYAEWWNAKDVSEYWRLWNTPVHMWGKRHLYMPLIAYGVRPGLAAVAVFTVSAVLHELLIGVPTHCLNGWAFGGMMAQMPLILQGRALGALRRRNEKLFDTVGNLFFWVSFTIVGQPAAILVYYSHWFKTRGSGG